VNTDGTALYACVVVMFLAQLSGVSLDFANQLLIVILALLTSLGVAGIPAASLVAIVVILQAVNHNLPGGQTIRVEPLAVILVFDRLLDMCRTMVNVLGDTVAAVVVARSEGEREVLATEPGPREAAQRAGRN
jgi:DAACS family dicarboxylate/amino acid:cation (Na+ or H+) symporter